MYVKRGGFAAGLLPVCCMAVPKCKATRLLVLLAWGTPVQVAPLPTTSPLQIADMELKFFQAEHSAVASVIKVSCFTKQRVDCNCSSLHLPAHIALMQLLLQSQVLLP